MLKAQLAAKQSALEQAKSDGEKTTLNAEITTLKAQIAAASTSDSQNSQPASNSNSKADNDRARWEESRPPEGKISSAVMSVLMQLSQGGMMPPDGNVDSGGERPSAADLYTRMDSDKNGSVSKSEFVAARPDHASEDEATSFFNSIDTKGTGSITEQQLADSMKNNGDHGGPDGHRMGPPGGNGMGSQDVALQQLLASLSASQEAEAKVV